MKKENIISIAGAILALVLIAYFSYDYYSDNPDNINAANTINSTTNTDGTMLAEEKVATHDSEDDCWLIIDNKVYDVTDYLRLHPGGKAIVASYCGQEATAAFDTKAGEGSHSQSAIEQLGTLYLGVLDQEMVETELVVTTETNTNTNPDTKTITVTPTTITLDSHLVAQHDNESDCWLTINNDVYDVTNYLILHPGGRSIIIPYCGKDATQAFDTKGGQGSHSTFADSQLNAYLIGVLGGDTTVEDIQNKQEDINQITPPSTSEDYDENEDEEEIEDDESNNNDEEDEEEEEEEEEDEEED